VSVGGVIIAAPSMAATRTSPAKTSTALKDGLAYFAGKTITFIAPTTAGSAYDVISRALVPEMASYLNATINVVDVSGANSVQGQNEIAASTPNGLTIGFLNLGADYYSALEHAPGLIFNPERMVFLGGALGSITNVLATQSNSAYPTFKSLLQSTATHPVAFDMVTGTTTMEAQLLTRAFGLHATFISGFTNSAAMVTGFVGGDGALVDTGVAQLQGEIAGNVVRPLAVDGNMLPSIKVLLKGVPRLPQLFAQYSTSPGEREAVKYFNLIFQQTNFALAAPSATPADEVAALDAAAKFGLESAAVKAANISTGHVPGFLLPDQAKSEFVNAMKVEPQLSTYLGF
jgi:tripartite-type tricarboxylate transporter receptor subunit TctC